MEEPKTITPEDIGHEAGEVLKSHDINPATGQPDANQPVIAEEVVVYDYDDDKNVIGWHKELKG